MSFAGPLTQEDLRAPKILVAAEKGKKKLKRKSCGTVRPKLFPYCLQTHSRSLEN